MRGGFGEALQIRFFLISSGPWEPSLRACMRLHHSTQKVDLIFSYDHRASVSDRNINISRILLIFLLFRRERNELFATPTAVI